MNTTDLLKRANLLIDKGEKILATYQNPGYSDYIETRDFIGFRTACLSFILALYGKDHVYYKEFSIRVVRQYASILVSGISILESIKDEIEQGWLISIKKLVTAEVFSDFLEMSKYFLDEGYKDPAAVMIGSVLEEHLRQLCPNYNVETTSIKGKDKVPKKADSLNADLTKAGAYGVLEQKNVTAWLDLRNRAAHGKYSEYAIEQVNLMYLGVLDFVSRKS